jgi:hypothetical protein
LLANFEIKGGTGNLLILLRLSNLKNYGTALQAFGAYDPGIVEANESARGASALSIPYTLEPAWLAAIQSTAPPIVVRKIAHGIPLLNRSFTSTIKDQRRA